MAERKSGPVKPPTIDLTPRSKPGDAPADDAKKPAESARSRTPETARAQSAAAKDKPAAKPDAKAETASGTRAASGGDYPKKTSAKAGSRAGAALWAGLAGTVFGGALGLAGAYGLAMAGYWPGGSDGTELAELRSDLTTLYVKKADVGGVVDRAVGEVQSGLGDLETRIAALESQAPAEAAPDLTPIETRLNALETGFADLGSKLDAAVIGGGDADATAAVNGIGARMDAMSATLRALETRPSVDPDTVAKLQTALSALQAEVATLSGGVSALQSAPEPEPVDLRLPLALSGLAEALETGASFDRELALITAALPDLAIPQSVSAAAIRGLGAPSALEAAFMVRVPDMLAARPADKSASWTDQALDRLKALVALRPVAADDDTTPEGLISHIEAALKARDYAVAAAAFEALPAPMQAKAGGLGDTMNQFAEAAALISAARSEALVLAGAGS